MSGTVKQDESGFYVQWDQRETLRTNDKDRAETWRIQGNCHGASDHDKSCDYCNQLTNTKEKHD